MAYQILNYDPHCRSTMSPGNRDDIKDLFQTYECTNDDNNVEPVSVPVPLSLEHQVYRGPWGLFLVSD